MVRAEAEAAAAEAAEIGGAGSGAGEDEARRPVEEAGGGVAEGFEQSEEELAEQASHGEDRSTPNRDAFAAEEAEGEGVATYGEPDEVHPTEVVDS